MVYRKIFGPTNKALAQCNILMLCFVECIVGSVRHICYCLALCDIDRKREHED